MSPLHIECWHLTENPPGTLSMVPRLGPPAPNASLVIIDGRRFRIPDAAMEAACLTVLISEAAEIRYDGFLGLVKLRPKHPLAPPRRPVRVETELGTFDCELVDS